MLSTAWRATRRALWALLRAALIVLMFVVPLPLVPVLRRRLDPRAPNAPAKVVPREDPR